MPLNMTHQCSICLKQFQFASKLQRHHLTHTGHRPFTCLLCGKAFRQSAHLKTHQETHAKQTPLLHDGLPAGDCSGVGSAASLFQGLQEDFTALPVFSPQMQETKLSERLSEQVTDTVKEPEHHWLPPVEWNTSDVITPKNILQEQQYNSVKPPESKVHQCTVCLKWFSSVHNLQRHYLNHSKQAPPEMRKLREKCPPYACHFGELPLASANLQQTEFSQSFPKGTVKHQCPECPKSFSSPSKLRRHCLIHTGQRPFCCWECGGTFRQLAHLKTHQQTHRKAQKVQDHVREQLDECMELQAPHLNFHQTSDGKLTFTTSDKPDNPPEQKQPDTQFQYSDGCAASLPLQQLSLLKNQENEEELSVLTVIEDIKTEDTQGLGKAGVQKGVTDTDGFKCDICLKLFPSESELKQHYLSHKVARPIQSGACGLVLTQQSHLKQGQDKPESHSEIQSPDQTENTQSWSSVPDDPLVQETKPDVLVHKERTSPFSNMAAVALQLELNIMVKSEHPDSCVEATQSEVSHVSEQHGQRQAPDKVKKNHQCATCLRRFPAPSKLQRHILIHTGQRPFGCHVCGKRFRQLTHMKLHAHTHTSPRGAQLKRDMVERGSVSFTQINSSTDPILHAATEKHVSEEREPEMPLEMSVSEIGPLENDFVGERNFRTLFNNSHKKHQCLFCLKIFTSPYKLKRHVLIHTGQKPFQCVSCGKTFRQAVHLKVHQQTHSRLKLYKGALQQKFLNLIRSAARLKNYSRELNQGRSPERSLAQAALNQSTGLSGEPIQENVMSMGKVHGKCRDVVGNCTYIPVKLKSYECSLCLKCFSAPSKLARHNLIHTGQRPFQCPICCRAFRQLCHLKAHHSVHARTRPTRQRQAPGTKGYEQNPEHQSVRNDSSSLEVGQANFTKREMLTPQTSSEKAKCKEASSGNDQCECLGSEGKNILRGNYRCSLCNRWFDSQYKFQRHCLTHTGRKPFHSYRKFRQPIHLKRHQQKHNGTKSVDLQNLDKANMLSLPESCQRTRCDYTLPDYNFSSEGILKIQNIQCSKDTAASQDSKLDGAVLATADCQSVDSGFVKNDQTELSLSVTQRAGGKQSQPAGGVSWVASPLYPSGSTSDQWTAVAQSRSDSSGFSVSTVQSAKSKAHQCTVCLKNFNSPSKLSRHFLIHTGAKPFSCAVCAKSFRQLCHLRTHQQVHKGMRHGYIWQSDGVYDHLSSIPPDSGTGPLPDTTVTAEEKKDEIWLPYITQLPGPDPNHSFAMGDQSDKLENSVPVQTVSDCELGGVGVPERNDVMPDGASAELSFAVTQFPPEKDRVQSMSDECGQLSPSTSDPFPSSICVVKESETTSVNTATTHVKIDQLQQPELTGQSCGNGSGSCSSDIDFQEHLEDFNFNLVGAEGGLRHKVDENLCQSGMRHTCPDCQRCFSSPSKLKRHCLIHAREKLFSCSICSKAFRQAVDLRSHQQVHALDSVHSFQQEVVACQSSRQDTCELYQEEPATEALCTSGVLGEGAQETWKSSEGGWWEPLSEVFSCQLCHLTFFTERELQLHRCPHGRSASARSSGSYQCAICFKKFGAPSKLKRHYVIHTGQRPFQCSFCGKTFTQSSHLKTHELIHK